MKDLYKGEECLLFSPYMQVIFDLIRWTFYKKKQTNYRCESQPVSALNVLNLTFKLYLTPLFCSNL